MVINDYNVPYDGDTLQCNVLCCHAHRFCSQLRPFSLTILSPVGSCVAVGSVRPSEPSARTSDVRVQTACTQAA